MNKIQLDEILDSKNTVLRNDIYVSKEISSKTVWDKLAVENPTHAVISANSEEEAAKKSMGQIDNIKQYLNPQDIMLDCGTGYGRVAKYLLPEFTLGGYVGVDSSYEMLSLFKKRYDENTDEQETPLLLLNADIHTLPIKDGSVDVAIVCAVFLHNHKSIVGRAMSEITRVMKPGGTVLVYSSFPRTSTLMGLQGHAYQFLLNLLGKPYKNGPVRYYRKREIVELFKDFAELDLVPVGFTVLPKTIVIFRGPLEKFWRLVIANPINSFLERITPASLKPYFAMHYDVVAKR